MCELFDSADGGMLDRQPARLGDDDDDQRGRRQQAGLAHAAAGITLAKLLLLLSSSVTGLGLFRVIERLGKSFRGPPRDAWLVAVAGQRSRGYALGVHKALDKSGAVVGPLIGIRDLDSGDSATATMFSVFSFLAQSAGLALGIAGTVRFVKDGKRQRAGQQQAGLHLGRGVYLRSAPRLGGGTVQLSYRF
mgnify:CR=1 FL=1